MKVFINNDHGRNALDLYHQLISLCLDDDICHVLAIKACANSHDLEMGEDIIRSLPRNRSVQLQSVMIEMYGNCKSIEDAENVYNSIGDDIKNMICSNAMIKAYINNGCNQKALDLYDTISKDNVSHLLGIKACINTGNFSKGRSIHSAINVKTADSQIKTVLIELYGHFGAVGDAENIFNSIDDRKMNIICIGAMMKVYVNNGDSKQALKLYDRFSSLNNDVTHLLAVKACIESRNYDKGKHIHSNFSLNNDHVIFKSALITLYGQCDDIITAQNIFDSISNYKKDLICIGAMMEAYCDCNMNNECIELFHQIKSINKDFIPNIGCYQIALKACTNGTQLDFGKTLHQDLLHNVDGNGWMLQESTIQCSLISMYGKYGLLNVCDDIFNDIKHNQQDKYLNDIGIWNAMIYAYAISCDVEGCKMLYNLMNNDIGLIPDRRIYILLINACSHSGLMMDALDLWENDLKENIDIKYDSHVINAMIDCLARKQYINHALDLLHKYEKHCGHNFDNNYSVIWNSLLNGCIKYKNELMSQYVLNQMENRFNLL